MRPRKLTSYCNPAWRAVRALEPCASAMYRPSSASSIGARSITTPRTPSPIFSAMPVNRPASTALPCWCSSTCSRLRWICRAVIDCPISSCSSSAMRWRSASCACMLRRLASTSWSSSCCFCIEARYSSAWRCSRSASRVFSSSIAAPNSSASAPTIETYSCICFGSPESGSRWLSTLIIRLTSTTETAAPRQPWKNENTTTAASISTCSRPKKRDSWLLNKASEINAATGRRVSAARFSRCPEPTRNAGTAIHITSGATIMMPMKAPMKWLMTKLPSSSTAFDSDSASVPMMRPALTSETLPSVST